MSDVSIIKCSSYDAPLVEERIRNSLDLIGFDCERFNGKTVALKPNMLMSARPKSAVMTHPVFFAAIAAIVKKSGGKMILTESPAIESIGGAISRSGFRTLVNENSISVADPGDSTIIVNPDEKRKYRRFKIIKAVKDADIVINLPKLKTHGITQLSVSAKNLFGLIPGLEKSRLHTTAPAREDFTELLLDLNEALKNAPGMPKTILNLVDGIVGLEGDGPGMGGKPREIGVIIAGLDAMMVDGASASVVGLDPRKVTTVDAAFRRGCSMSSFDEVRMSGDPIKDVKISGFKTVSGRFSTARMTRWPFNTRFVRNLVNQKPSVIGPQCRQCGHCAVLCPVKAIRKNADGSIAIDYKTCIRCYCCSEICPYAAIGLQGNGLLKIMPF